MVSYFTGNWDFHRGFQTVLGSIRIGRDMSVDTLGRRTEDCPIIVIDFDEEPTGTIERTSRPSAPASALRRPAPASAPNGRP